MHDMRDPLLGRTLGPYQVEAVLGRGGGGAVYRVRYESSLFALKVLDLTQSPPPGLIDRFRGEVELAERLRHPNIVRTYGGGQERQYLYLVMEYVDAGSLKDYLAQISKHLLPVPEALRIARQICSALEYAHGHGVIHRDVKPGNILRRQDGRALLGDFGVAQTVAESRPQAGRAAGTPAYRPPEQAQGQMAIPSSDVYALGCVLYEMLTGELPFRAENEMALLYKQLHETPRRLRDGSGYIPPPLQPIVEHALHKEPARRYHSAQALGQALGQAMEQLAVSQIVAGSAPDRGAAPVAPPVWSVAPRRARALGAVLVAAGIVLALVIAGILWGPSLMGLALRSPTPPRATTMARRSAAPATTVAAIPTTGRTVPTAIQSPARMTVAPNAAATQYARETATAAARPRATTMRKATPPSPTASNRPPTVRIEGIPASARVDEDVALVCVATDPDGDRLVYKWYADDVLRPKVTTNAWSFVPNETGLGVGRHTIRVVVSDGHGHDVGAAISFELLPASSPALLVLPYPGAGGQVAQGVSRSTTTR